MPQLSDHLPDCLAGIQLQQSWDVLQQECARLCFANDPRELAEEPAASLVRVTGALESLISAKKALGGRDAVWLTRRTTDHDVRPGSARVDPFEERDAHVPRIPRVVRRSDHERAWI